MTTKASRSLSSESVNGKDQIKSHKAGSNLSPVAERVQSPVTDEDTFAWIALSLQTPQTVKKELKFLSSIRRKTAAFDSEEREFLMGLGHYKVCINIYPAGEYDSRVKAMLCLPKKAARKSPQVHPPFYPPALILVFASQIPVSPLTKKKPLSCQGNPESRELAGFSTAKKSYGKAARVTVRNGWPRPRAEAPEAPARCTKEPRRLQGGVTLPAPPRVASCSPPWARTTQHRSAGTEQVPATEPRGQGSAGATTLLYSTTNEGKAVLKLAQNTASLHFLTVLIKRKPGQICSHFSTAMTLQG